MSTQPSRSGPADDDELARLLAPARRALADDEAIARSVRLARARTLSGAAPRAAFSTKRVVAPLRALAFASAMAAFVLVTAVLTRTYLHGRAPEGAQAISFSVAGAPGVVGERQVAVTARALDFDDGTRVDLDPRGALRVLSLDARGGRLLVEQGTIHAAFRHREHTRWTVEAGGMVVEVTGTRFDVSFDPTTQAFELVMHEGSVRLRGCGIEQGRVARGTDAVRASCGSSEPTPAPLPRPLTPADLPSAAPPAEASSSHSAREAAPAPVDGSLELLARADASRRAGDIPTARATLLALRSRFPRGRGAPEAAFDLGVLAFDVDGHHDEAARWFRRYLDESPRGPLAREALGRVMEAQSSSGDTEAAAATATRYLESHPGGPHASLAKRLAAQRP
jgi:ferric-dicitrate binding protein FerR (iron transport regulator)